MTFVLIIGRTETQGRCRDWSDVSTSQGLPETRKRQRRHFSSTFRGSMALLIPWFWTSSLQNFEIIHFCYFKPLRWGSLVTAALGVNTPRNCEWRYWRGVNTVKTVQSLRTPQCRTLNSYTVGKWVRRMTRELVHSDQSWNDLISTKKQMLRQWGKSKLHVSLGMQG